VRMSLRRPIDADKHICEIDGLRLLAIAVVVGSHIAPSVARHYQDVTGVETYDDVILRLTSEGVRGVTLFFVISGFVLSLPFLRASATGGRVSVRRYLVRRLRRIEPPYVVSLAVFLLADVVLLARRCACGTSILRYAVSAGQHRGRSSAGRAPALQAGGRRFESARLHQSRSSEPCKAARDHSRHALGEVYETVVQMRNRGVDALDPATGRN
jgi:hypothetical protein